MHYIYVYIQKDSYIIYAFGYVVDFIPFMNGSLFYFKPKIYKSGYLSDNVTIFGKTVAWKLCNFDASSAEQHMSRSLLLI